MNPDANPAQRTAAPRAFTLVEVLVVLGIIIVLVGLLLPVVASVQATSRQITSQSNMKEWGTGTLMYTGSHKDRLPWEGHKDLADMPTNLGEAAFWANAIPPLVGEKPYSEIVNGAINEGFPIPLPGGEAGRSIYIDPSATLPASLNGTDSFEGWPCGSTGSLGFESTCYFNYVPNGQLNNTYKAQAGIADFAPNQTMSLSMIQDAAHTILMLEMRSVPEELDGSDPNYGESLDRHRGDWKRFAARHFDGGHLLYTDGHVGLHENRRVITNRQGTTDPAQAGGDWNVPGEFIWDPLGPAMND